jgi:hypothetical protein
LEYSTRMLVSLTICALLAWVHGATPAKPLAKATVSQSLARNEPAVGAVCPGFGRQRESDEPILETYQAVDRFLAAVDVTGPRASHYCTFVGRQQALGGTHDRT